MLKANYEGREIDLVQCFFDEEFDSFPVPYHDDMLDALARIVEPDLPLRFPDTEKTVITTKPATIKTLNKFDTDRKGLLRR